MKDKYSGLSTEEQLKQYKKENKKKIDTERLSRICHALSLG